MELTQAPIPPKEFTHLSDYESWASQNWLHQNGTLDAQLHARYKFAEEIQELAEALKTGSADDIVSEAGDVLWTGNASGVNAEISIQSSLQEAFSRYFTSESPSVAQLDEVALEVFDGTNMADMINHLNSCELTLGKAAKQWLTLRQHVSSEGTTFTDAYIRLKRDRAVSALARTTLLVSYVAQEFAGSTIGEVMHQNYLKIEGRRTAGAELTRPPRIR